MTQINTVAPPGPAPHSAHSETPGCPSVTEMPLPFPDPLSPGSLRPHGCSSASVRSDSKTIFPASAGFCPSSLSLSPRLTQLITTHLDLTSLPKSPPTCSPTSQFSLDLRCMGSSQELTTSGTFLVVQWLRAPACKAGGVDSIHGQ